jgi:hypothetical protein
VRALKLNQRYLNCCINFHNFKQVWINFLAVTVPHMLQHVTETRTLISCLQKAAHTVKLLWCQCKITQILNVHSWIGPSCTIPWQFAASTVAVVGSWFNVYQFLSNWFHYKPNDVQYGTQVALLLPELITYASVHSTVLTVQEGWAWPVPTEILLHVFCRIELGNVMHALR